MAGVGVDYAYGMRCGDAWVLGWVGVGMGPRAGKAK